MNETLQNKRHTLAHLLASAVLHFYPDAKLTIGPAVDNGFYYDIDFGGEKVGDGELEKIEGKMREILPSWQNFTHREVSADEAREHFAGNPYKLELIDEIVGKGENITLYTCGNFTDLCRGGHLENPSKEIAQDSFCLDKVAGAYWRGDEKNKMLTRIYGLAFDTASELSDYKKMLEDAKLRDHRKIGSDLDLFVFSPLVGSGLPLWTPEGTVVREELNNFVWSLRKKYDYQRVTIPHITKKDLYETSGHWAKFADELFKINTREGKEYAMKPMNCPHHTQIYAHLQRSYRDLPQRYAETTMVYRDEQSGELGGLTRVLSITQDDAHVFCRKNQIEQEFNIVWSIIEEFYKKFGFELRVRLSFHDPEKFEKYLGDKSVWQESEKIIQDIAKTKDTEYFIGIGEAAMYGPKLDFMAKDSIGREHQVATIQLDMNLPERFNLHCINEEGVKERIVMIHCAIMGSIERFSAVLLEHTMGILPFWLSPHQVAIIPVKDSHLEYAEELLAKMKSENIRAKIIYNKESLGKRIHESKSKNTPITIVLGDKEIESGNLTLEKLNGEKETISKDEFIAKANSKNINREVWE